MRPRKTNGSVDALYVSVCRLRAGYTITGAAAVILFMSSLLFSRAADVLATLFACCLFVGFWLKLIRTNQVRVEIAAAFENEISASQHFGRLLECCCTVPWGDGLLAESYVRGLNHAASDLCPDSPPSLTREQLILCHSLISVSSYDRLDWLRNNCQEAFLDKIWFIGDASTIPVLEKYVSKQTVASLRTKGEIALNKLRERLGDSSLLREVIVDETRREGGQLLRGTNAPLSTCEGVQSAVSDVSTATEPRETGHHSAS